MKTAVLLLMSKSCTVRCSTVLETWSGHIPFLFKLQASGVLIKSYSIFDEPQHYICSVAAASIAAAIPRQRRLYATALLPTRFANVSTMYFRRCGYSEGFDAFEWFINTSVPSLVHAQMVRVVNSPSERLHRSPIFYILHLFAFDLKNLKASKPLEQSKGLGGNIGCKNENSSGIKRVP